MRIVVVMMLALGMGVPAWAQTPAQMAKLANMMGILGGSAKACGALEPELQLYRTQVNKGLDAAGPYAADERATIDEHLARGWTEGFDVQTNLKQSPCPEVLEIWRAQAVWKQ